jgi:uncharacterized membrane protein
VSDAESSSGGGQHPERREDDTVNESEVVEERPASREWHYLSGEVIEAISFRQAPYPTPGDLRQYEAIHPGFTDRILTLTERETEHRIQQERLQTRATIKLANRGQVFAFIVVMTLVIGGIVSILAGHSVEGLIGLAAAGGTVAAAFIAPRVFSRAKLPDHPGREITERGDTAAEGDGDRG